MRSSVLALLIAGVVAVMVLSGCGMKTSPKQDPQALAAQRWALATYMDESGATVKVSGPEELYIDFDGKSGASGFSGVNTFRGKYSADEGGAIEIGPLASTMIAGPEAAMAQESAFLKALDEAEFFTVSAKELVLLDDQNKPLATFGPGAPPAALEGTDWICTGYNNGQEAFVGILADTEVTALFKDGTLSGNAGVNTYNGGYKLEGSSLTIDENMAVTMMAGAPEAMDQESAYLAALPKVRRYGVDGKTLTLYGDGDLRLVTYTTK